MIDSVPRLTSILLNCSVHSLWKPSKETALSLWMVFKPVCQESPFLLSSALYMYGSHLWVCMSFRRGQTNIWICLENVWAFGVIKSWLHCGFFQSNIFINPLRISRAYNVFWSYSSPSPPPNFSQIHYTTPSQFVFFFSFYNNRCGFVNLSQHHYLHS